MDERQKRTEAEILLELKQEEFNKRNCTVTSVKRFEVIDRIAPRFGFRVQVDAQDGDVYTTRVLIGNGYTYTLGEGQVAITLTRKDGSNFGNIGPFWNEVEAEMKKLPATAAERPNPKLRLLKLLQNSTEAKSDTDRAALIAQAEQLSFKILTDALDKNPDDYTRASSAASPELLNVLFGDDPDDLTTPAFAYNEQGKLQANADKVLWRKTKNVGEPISQVAPIKPADQQPKPEEPQPAAVESNVDSRRAVRELNTYLEQNFSFKNPKLQLVAESKEIITTFYNGPDSRTEGIIIRLTDNLAINREILTLTASGFNDNDGRNSGEYYYTLDKPVLFKKITLAISTLAGYVTQ